MTRMSKTDRFTIISGSERETERIGRAIGEAAFAGLVVALRGELGSGKTVLVRGLARGLGIDYAPITSPSFVIVNRYDGRLPLFHIDFYRLEHMSEAYELGLDEMASEGVVAIEWADRFADVVPSEHIEIDLEIAGETERRITIAAHGTGEREVLARVGAGSWR